MKRNMEKWTQDEWAMVKVEEESGGLDIIPSEAYFFDEVGFTQLNKVPKVL